MRKKMWTLKGRGLWRRLLRKKRQGRVWWGSRKEVRKLRTNKWCGKCRMVSYCLTGRWPDEIRRCVVCNHRSGRFSGVGWVVGIQRCPGRKAEKTKRCMRCRLTLRALLSDVGSFEW